MMLKNRIWILAIGLWSAPTLFAEVLSADRASGLVVTCKNAKGKLKSAETLDWYEATNDPSLKLNTGYYSDGNDQVVFNGIIAKLESLETNKPLWWFNPELEEAVFKMTAFDAKFFNRLIQANRSPLPVGAEIPLPEKFHARVFPTTPGCKIEAAVLHKADGSVLVNEVVLAKMTGHNRAMLWMNEALTLAALSNLGEANSDAIRIFVGSLFSAGDDYFLRGLKTDAFIEDHSFMWGRELNRPVILRASSSAASAASFSFDCRSTNFTIRPGMEGQDTVFGVPNAQLAKNLNGVELNAMNDGKEHLQMIQITRDSIKTDAWFEIIFKDSIDHEIETNWKIPVVGGGTQVTIKLRKW